MAADIRKSGRVVALDGDKLGHVAGAAVALAVVVMHAFYRESGPLTTLTRGAWTFVGVYAGIFFLTRVVLRATIRQMIEERRRRREEVLRRRKEARDRASEIGLALPVEQQGPPEQAETLEQPGESAG